MADEAITDAPKDAPAPTPAVEPATSSEKAQSTGTNGDASSLSPSAETSSKNAKLEEPAGNGENEQAAEPAPAEASAEPTPSAAKDKKLKSPRGVPEHKSKKLSKKKSMPALRLDCKPGEFYWARLKGYPPWPSVICDEEMLPESLLATRPVSTARPDGSIRDDFKEGGKNAKERTFPVMFLSTNEFQWMANTSLTPLDPEDCKNPPPTKITKALQSAYDVAAQNHSIEYFKKILYQWQEEEEAIRREQEEAAAEAERVAAEEAAKAEEGQGVEAEKKPKKRGPRKSKAADEDAEVEEAEAPKSSKKRKKDTENDADGPKLKKTPKVTKLNAPKTPNVEASTSKKSKPKKKVVSAPKAEDDETKPQLTDAEKQSQREKAVLYLRHRLQKGFLSRDQAPQQSEMAAMADFFTQLEGYDNLEPTIIRNTKIHKVLKAIVKLASVPKDDEFHFKKRSSTLLEAWNKRMDADLDAVPQSAPKEKPDRNNANAEMSGAKESSENPAASKDIEMTDAPNAAEADDSTEHRTEAEPDADVTDAADDAAAAADVEPAEEMTDSAEQTTESKDDVDTTNQVEEEN